MRAPWIASIALFVPLLAGAATPARQESVGIQASPQGIPLLEFLAQAQEIVGGAWLFEPKDVKDERIFLAANVEIPRDRFLAFFEQCLAGSFAHVESRGSAITTHRLVKLGAQTRWMQLLKTYAPLVTTAELDTMAERHTVVTIVVETKHVPAREAVTTLNLYFADSANESIRNIEGTDQIIMTGFSDSLSRAIAMLTRIDAASADDQQVLESHEITRAYNQLAARVAALEEKLAALSGGKK